MAMPEKRCVILCSGLSVRGCDLSRIHVPVIGVNWSVLGRQPKIHVISNMVLIRKHQGTIAELSPLAEFRFSGLPLAGAYTPATAMRYCNIGHYQRGLKIPKLPSDYNVYHYGWVFAGGGPCALQVAISFGYKEIIFVGLDLEHGKDMHFYSHENGATCSAYSGYSRKQLDHAWIVQRAYFEQTKGQFTSEMGIKIINTGWSDVFEHVPFDEVFPDHTPL